MIRDERLQILIQRIVDRLAPEEVWLFGSQARGDAEPDSDYDLLVVMSDQTPTSMLEPIYARKQVLTGLHIPTDIISCTHSEFEEEKHEIDTLARVAWREGKKVYERTP